MNARYAVRFCSGRRRSERKDWIGHPRRLVTLPVLFEEKNGSNLNVEIFGKGML